MKRTESCALFYINTLFTSWSSKITKQSTDAQRDVGSSLSSWEAPFAVSACLSLSSCRHPSLIGPSDLPLTFSGLEVTCPRCDTPTRFTASCWLSQTLPTPLSLAPYETSLK